MQVFLSILSVGLLGFIIYFAVSPKSSGLLRLTALAALGLIAISILVCGIMLIRGPSEPVATIPLPFLPESSPPPEKKSDLPMLIGFLVVFLFLLALIYYSARKERQRKEAMPKEPAKPKAAQTSDAEVKEESDTEKINLDDDTFDIGLDKTEP